MTKKSITRGIVGILMILVVFVSCKSNKNNTDQNTQAVEKPMYRNGDFEDGSVEPWAVFTQGGSARLSVEKGALCIDIGSVGSVEYAVQLYQDVGKLEYGCEYRMQFDMWSTLPRDVEYRIQMNGGNYQAYSMKHISINEEKQSFIIDFTMDQTDDLLPRLAFNMGYPVNLPKGEQVESHKIYLDNLSLTVTDTSNRSEESLGGNKPNISVNLLGYQKAEKKIAVFRSLRMDGKGLDKSFSVFTEEGKKVFTGKVVNPKQNYNANETNAYGDFSELSQTGTYYIESKLAGRSELFHIGEDIYEEAFDAVLKMLYLQRCGSALDVSLAGDFAHPVCHNTLARIYPTDRYIDVSGGWHDAGDYGRYVVPGAKTVADILLAYMHYPHAFDDNLGIPESGNGIPDVLDEARYELQWLLKMQDKETGGVYHKVTGASFPGFVMPEDETEELILSPISLTATGDFAAVLAMAVPIYESLDLDFATKMKEAALFAWDYLAANKSFYGFMNPPSIATGEYDDRKDSDERYWAAVELYKLTGEKRFHDALLSITENVIPTELGWQTVGDYGSISYLTMDVEKQDPEFVARLKTSMDWNIRSLKTLVENDGYGISMGSNYPWGSNMTVANNAMRFLFFDMLNQTDEYREIAKNHLHYFFGRNPLMMSYVTGFGNPSPQYPHHRPSEAKKKAMPGMLVGGPNSSLEDPYAKAVLYAEAPAKTYADHSQSYSTNEICIYWNSPLIYVMAALCK